MCITFITLINSIFIMCTKTVDKFVDSVNKLDVLSLYQVLQRLHIVNITFISHF